MAAVACTGYCISLLYAATDASMEIVGTGLPTRFPSLWVRVHRGSSPSATCGGTAESGQVNPSERS